MKYNSIRKDEKGVSPVIAVILMVAITVVLAGVLYAWVGIFNTTPPDQYKISATTEEKTTYWKVTIAATSGGSLDIEEVKFQVLDTSSTVFYKVDISNANPGSILRGGSMVYPIPSGASPVIDNSTGNIVDKDSELRNYENCYITYNDQNADSKLNAGDNIWIYKDFDNNDKNDVKSNYVFEILVGKEIPLKIEL